MTQLIRYSVAVYQEDRDQGWWRWSRPERAFKPLKESSHRKVWLATADELDRDQRDWDNEHPEG